jgi:hypothetical protein
VGTAWTGRGREVACSGAWSRGTVPTNQPLSFEASPNQEFTVRASMFGKVCLRHRRRLRRASARHSIIYNKECLQSSIIDDSFNIVFLIRN